MIYLLFVRPLVPPLPSEIVAALRAWVESRGWYLIDTTNPKARKDRAWPLLELCG